jgi:hypothetical protein
VHASFLSFENLTGSRFADALTGSACANALQGGESSDLIWGSAGADRYTVGPGADQFLYRSEAEIGNGMDAYDCILDANPSKSGDQGFSWIGTAAFRSPGQLRYTVVNGVGLLEGNTIGTSGAEPPCAALRLARRHPAVSWLTVNRSAEIRVVSPAEQFFDSWLSAFPPRLKDR